MTDTFADILIKHLAEKGVRRMFGVPGGGSSLDLIDAGSKHGVDFVLSQTETAGAIMAAVTGELSGTPGVVLTGVGPGAASVVNGTAYASLEKSPLVIFTDQVEGTNSGGIHQKYDQQALFAPLTRDGGALEAETGPEQFANMVSKALTPPLGPVHVDLSAMQAAKPAQAAADVQKMAGTPVTQRLDPALKPLLEKSRKPVFIVGLEARDAAIAAALRGIVSRLDCPCLTTYKAKGVIPDADPLLVGHITGGTAEAATLHAADLIIAVGLDPVELINQPWPYKAPVIDISDAPHEDVPYATVLSCSVDPAAALSQLVDAGLKSQWSDDEIASLKSEQQARLIPPDGVWTGPENDPRHLVQAVLDAAANATLSVDAGAHMFPVMALWQADRPFGVLKSNGLSTMGYAVPAGIAAALHDPSRPVIAITGDGGLSMCLSELATAARLGVKLITIVFNDAALSLIDIKQQAQQRKPIGVRYPAIDFASASSALGVPGFKAVDSASLTNIVQNTLTEDGPCLIEVAVDPSGYPEMLAALRK